jgi:hypothetical protein
MSRERFLALLRDEPTKRVALPRLEAHFRTVFPFDSAAADSRTALRDLLKELHQHGLSLPSPRTKTAWDGPVPASALPPVVPLGYAWMPRLAAFAPRETRRDRQGWLMDINAWMKRRTGTTLLRVPIKERSLEIFGDEKQLDRLARPDGTLFSGNLHLDDLHCFIAPLPLPWAPGPECARGRPILMVENRDTWTSFRLWNAEHGRWSAVTYGGGGSEAGISFDEADIARIAAHTAAAQVTYFGDIDLNGVRIGRGLSERQAVRGGLAVVPEVTLYRHIIARGLRTPAETPSVLSAADHIWLGPLADDVAVVLASGQRIAQENLGLEVLAGREPLFH